MGITSSDPKNRDRLDDEQAEEFKLIMSHLPEFVRSLQQAGLVQKPMRKGKGKIDAITDGSVDIAMYVTSVPKNMASPQDDVKDEVTDQQAFKTRAAEPDKSGEFRIASNTGRLVQMFPEGVEERPQRPSKVYVQSCAGNLGVTGRGHGENQNLNGRLAKPDINFAFGSTTSTKEFGEGSAQILQQTQVQKGSVARSIEEDWNDGHDNGATVKGPDRSPENDASLGPRLAEPVFDQSINGLASGRQSPHVNTHSGQLGDTGLAKSRSRVWPKLARGWGGAITKVDAPQDLPTPETQLPK